MSSFEFPLRRKPTPLGSISDPVIPVAVRTLAGEIVLRFLLDSGADFSLAPRRLAQLAGLAWEGLPTARVMGIGMDTIDARVGTLPLRIGDAELAVRRIFVDSANAPLVLGRADVFDHFAITFDAGRQRITLTELS